MVLAGPLQVFGVTLSSARDPDMANAATADFRSFGKDLTQTVDYDPAAMTRIPVKSVMT